MPKRAGWIAAVLIAAGWAGAAWAQATSHTLSAGPAYTSKDGKDGPQFPRMDIVVRLRDGAGALQPVQAADLKLFSGKTELGSGSSVRTFADAGYGVKSILALDMSGSMKGSPLAAIRSTIARFVDQARAQDRVEVLTFANDSRVEVPFGADQATLAERLRQVASRGTETHLYDSLLDALAQLEGAPPICRQLIVISDGHDEGSQHTIDDVIRAAQSAKVPIDSIGLTRSHPEYLQTLASISQATGGSYAQARSPQDLEGLIDQGIKAMRAMPVAGFKVSGLASDGKPHTLEVRWQPEKLTAAIEVHTPSMRNPWTLWGWVLAGCFVVGAVLLIVSRRLARREAAEPAPQPRQMQPLVSAQPEAPPQPNRSGFTAAVEDYRPAQEISPLRAHVPTFVEGSEPVQRPVRAKTQLAAFFDADRNLPILEAIAGPVTGQSFAVSGELLIGALDGNGLSIPGDPTLSGFHARVRLADRVLTIEDVRSTNGTFVNGVKLGLDRKLLRPGDEIRVGRSIFRVRGG
jgi:VWFA-related protein